MGQTAERVPSVSLCIKKQKLRPASESFSVYWLELTAAFFFVDKTHEQWRCWYRPGIPGVRLRCLSSVGESHPVRKWMVRYQVPSSGGGKRWLEASGPHHSLPGGCPRIDCPTRQLLLRCKNARIAWAVLTKKEPHKAVAWMQASNY